MENKTITTSVLAAIITGLLVLGGVTIFDKNVYYCEDKNIVMQCDSLSKYYGLPNGKCNNAKVGNKLCPSGWIEVVNDVIIEKEIISPSGSPGEQYLCSTESCKKTR